MEMSNQEYDKACINLEEHNTICAKIEEYEKEHGKIEPRLSRESLFQTLLAYLRKHGNFDKLKKIQRNEVSR